ncbi:hypothetical protein COLO4_07476 [Corchorus olitorius]|uniref:Uncharacterized protein n=1 Tax=Corchorus olitorius TaxID=93759 RepID=A0A1R3KJK1_9ROSI|nr:hypothetical protein COLO4_07476 [Corchorus olitorius]
MFILLGGYGKSPTKHRSLKSILASESSSSGHFLVP